MDELSRKALNAYETIIKKIIHPEGKFLSFDFRDRLSTAMTFRCLKRVKC